MPFQKGNTYGNRKGRPAKGQATAELLRAFGDLQYKGTDKTYRERAAQVLWEQAAGGSLQALQWIVERTEGKVPDTIRQEVSGTLDHGIGADKLEAVLRHYAQSSDPGAGTG